ncbi:stress-responsive transcription factor HSF1 KNAG_0F02020 [Huiozyma naganishii CBS 8797]|uniref:Heat shock transcription factor n=1 Tax=Huiozyma naganishii (strain ATCC MYA-139 / BCRC 22969 / CBS 8797 / KCTC 17520 / NBRC 10181 / NCYC 3082 / Yp74L-3) TaxID=1071383 RepID=J7S7A8_HUIN7|nr:hypothetical protein KNAG_0F02020 [Kazachstania naganishii CBS 8797]CCK70869.1 hypothetical protein KNAG_0F02020 [Kazachstania naganishii CBS 8797]
MAEDKGTEKLPDLYDEEIADMLHPDALFSNDTPAFAEPNDEDLNKNQSVRVSLEEGKPKSPTSVSTTTVEDIINPYFETAANKARNDASAERSLMLARDANHAHIIRRNSPLNAFHGEAPLASDELLSSNILRNSLQSPQYTDRNNQLQQQQQQQQTRRGNSHKTRPAFVNKLWSMLNDQANLDLIRWADDGKSFIVTNREKFVHDILPKYFKHSNFASFVRQLNMYGWHKVQDVKSGSIQNSTDDRWQFENEHFQKGREDLLHKIVRQKSTTNSQQQQQHQQQHVSTLPAINSAVSNLTSEQRNELLKKISGYQLPSNLNPTGTLHITNGPESIAQQTNIGTLLDDLEQIKYNQVAISKDLLRISKDNEMLWKENMIARERHRTQQQALEKIFRFLAAMMPHMDQKLIMDGMVDAGAHQINEEGVESANTGQAEGNRMNEALFDEIISNTTNDQEANSVQGASSLHRAGAARRDHVGNQEHHNTYLEDLTDLEESRFRGGHTPLRPSTRLLLKNRANSNNSQSHRPTISPVDLGDLGARSVDKHTGRISEIPFDEDDHIGSKLSNDSINHHSIEEIRTTPTLSSKNRSPRMEDYKGSASERDDSHRVEEPSPEIDDGGAMIDHLQDSIENQDERIHHLEEMIQEIAPHLMTAQGSAAPQQGTNTATTAEPVPQGLQGSQVPQVPQGTTEGEPLEQPGVSPGLDHSLFTPFGGFSLQDYFGNDAATHPDAGSGLTPLLIDDPGAVAGALPSGEQERGPATGDEQRTKRQKL